MTIVEGNTGLWIRRFHPTDQAKVRLICFPHAGGSASFYYPLSRTMPDQVEVLAIQYPGRQDRRHEEPIGNLRVLAAQIVDELRPWTDLPMCLFGHSLGATLAFEVARALEREGLPPHSLIASGRRAPSRHRDERVHEGDDRTLLTQLAKLDGTSQLVLGDEEAIRMILPALRSDYRAAETYRYRPGPRLSCPVYALAGDRDSMADLAEVSAWSDHTSGAFEMRVFEGGHFFLVDHAAAIQRFISDLLTH